MKEKNVLSSALRRSKFLFLARHFGKHERCPNEIIHFGCYISSGFLYHKLLSRYFDGLKRKKRQMLKHLYRAIRRNCRVFRCEWWQPISINLPVNIFYTPGIHPLKVWYPSRNHFYICRWRKKIRKQARRGNSGTEQENRAGEKAGKKKREGGWGLEKRHAFSAALQTYRKDIACSKTINKRNIKSHWIALRNIFCFV